MSIKELFTKDPIYVMDGSAFIYRGFYANQSMQRSDGFPTSAIFIIARILLRILREEQPKNFVFVLDGPGKNFRHNLFPLYKAQRSSAPEALIKQIEPIKRLMDVLGLCLEVSQDSEADDCIASIAKRYCETQPVVLIASDKDLKQCLHENVLMWDPMSKAEKITTLKSFTTEEGLLPAQWPDVQAIIGDTSDNIPGVPGVGLKTAKKIFQEFPSLESIRDNVTSLPQTIQKKFDGHIESMFLYRQLTTLLTTQCQKLQLKDMQIGQIKIQEAFRFLREFELISLERELTTLIQQTNPTLTKNDIINGYNSSSSTASQEQFSLLELPKTAHKKYISTVHDLPSLKGKIVALLAENDEVALAVEGIEYLYTGPWLALTKLLVHTNYIITPNVKSLLRSNGIWRTIPNSHWFDLGLATYLLDPEERDYSWPKLLARWGTVFELSPGNPALIALKIGEQLYKRLQGAHLLDLMKSLELPLIPVLADMESIGITLDTQALKVFLIEVQNNLEQLTETIYKEAGGPFNIRSAQQLGDILFNQLKLPTSKKTRNGQASTSQDVLEKLSGHHTIITTLLEYRKLEKLRSTYLEPLPCLVGKDRRIHTTFNQLATATGRLSSSNPNLQNIPIRGMLGQRMRSCFTASEGHLLVSADYSQIELRVLAHYSKEPTLITAFLEGMDIHTRTASLLYKKEQTDITSDERRNAKTINFGLLYGMGPQKLAQELNTTLTEAKKFIQNYFKQFLYIKDFYDKVELSAKEHGYVTTLAGRRRLLPEIHSENTQNQALARRQAINTLIQGSAADIIKIAMLTVHTDPELSTMDAQILLQVHDELVMEVPEAYASDAGKHVATLMSNVKPGGISLDVPLVTEWGMGYDWGSAH